LPPEPFPPEPLAPLPLFDPLALLPVEHFGALPLPPDPLPADPLLHFGVSPKLYPVLSHPQTSMPWITSGPLAVPPWLPTVADPWVYPPPGWLSTSM
jgi:hypothetical protein